MCCARHPAIDPGTSRTARLAAQAAGHRIGSTNPVICCIVPDSRARVSLKEIAAEPPSRSNFGSACQHSSLVCNTYSDIGSDMDLSRNRRMIKRIKRETFAGLHCFAPETRGSSVSFSFWVADACAVVRISASHENLQVDERGRFNPRERRLHASPSIACRFFGNY